MTSKTAKILHLVVPLALLFLNGCEEGAPPETQVPVSSESTLPENAPTSPPVQAEDGEMTADQRKEVLDKILQEKGRQQAEGLGSGKVTVNGAWNYKGYSYLSPDPNAAIEARLVAVDVTISGHTENFDIDDIEIVDGISLISYGSDPHPEFLTLDGKIMPADQFPVSPPGASRWLLIYAFPKATPTFHLYYWGKQLTPSPVSIGDSGLELPYPPKE